MTVPDPSRVSLDLHTNDSGVEVAVVTFLVSVQQTMLKGFNDVVHNTALRLAHERGVLPEGEAWISVGPAQSRNELREGEAIAAGLDDLALDNAIMEGNIVQVRVEFLVGVRL